MQTVGLNHELHKEIAGALERGERARVAATPGPSDLVKLAAVVCIGAGVVLGGIGVLLSLTVLGAAALWLSFQRDDAAIDHGLDELFDRRTGLPLACGLESVLNDDLVSRSLSGRLAVVAIDIPEVAAREAAGDHAAAEALMVAITHRLQSHGWIENDGSPFAPLVFLHRPGVFHVVLRDVLDLRTTRWLTGRMLDSVNRPVPWDGSSLDPRAVAGLAVGSGADRGDLVRQATDACHRARLTDTGTVVSSNDAERPANTWLVSVVDDSAIGKLIDTVPAGGEMFAESAAFLRALDEALEFASASGERCFVRAPGTALCHWDMPARVASRVNAARLHGRVGIVVPSDLVDRSTRLAWENLEQIRLCGIDLYVDRSGVASTSRSMPDQRFDGVITAPADNDEVTDAQARLMADAEASDIPLVVVAVIDVEHEVSPWLEVAGDGKALETLANPDFPRDRADKTSEQSADLSTDRPVVQGRATHVAQGSSIPVR